ncbi:MAG: hypothetical protein C3F19_00815 [Rhodocyclales bacterium]|nr:MAG: hypothetical protein C3F19_00815 [Rhodocyclales bacterium]
MQSEKRKNMTGFEVRGILGDALKTAAASFGKGGLKQEDVATGSLMVKFVAGVTNNFKAELMQREQLIRMGVSAKSIGKLGDQEMA